MYPSIKTLMYRLSLDKDTAKKVRLAMEGPGMLPLEHEKYRQHYNPPSKLDRKMDALDLLLKGYGIEAIRDGSQWDRYWGDTVAIYVNMGDTYNSTILYDVERDSFCVTTWGDWVETAERSRRYTFA